MIIIKKEEEIRSKINCSDILRIKIPLEQSQKEESHPFPNNRVRTDPNLQPASRPFRSVGCMDPNPPRSPPRFISKFPPPSNLDPRKNICSIWMFLDIATLLSPVAISIWFVRNIWEKTVRPVRRIAIRSKFAVEMEFVTVISEKISDPAP